MDYLLLMLHSLQVAEEFLDDMENVLNLAAAGKRLEAENAMGELLGTVYVKGMKFGREIAS